MLGIAVDVAEQLVEGALLGLTVVVGAPELPQLEGLEQHGHRDLSLAVDLDRDQVLGRGLDLQPRTTVRDQLGAEQPSTRGRVFGRREVDAWGPDELGY